MHSKQAFLRIPVPASGSFWLENGSHRVVSWLEALGVFGRYQLVPGGSFGLTWYPQGPCTPYTPWGTHKTSIWVDLDQTAEHPTYRVGHCMHKSSRLSQYRRVATRCVSTFYRIVFCVQRVMIRDNLHKPDTETKYYTDTTIFL
mgnify:CR=1 FL=1